MLFPIRPPRARTPSHAMPRAATSWQDYLLREHEVDARVARER